MKGKKYLSAVMSLAVFTSYAGTIGLPIWADEEEDDLMVAEFNGHYYAVIEEKLTPPEAKKYCEEFGGYLASITSQEEQDFVASLAAQVDYSDFWIGASDDGSEGEWYWMNGEPWGYTAWYPGGPVGTEEPNNGLGAGDDYAAMNRERDYLWVDAFGGYDGYTTTAYFIFEYDGESGRKTFGGHEYQRFDEGMSWDEAEEYCESRGGHLVTITSAEEQAFVETLLGGEDVKNNYWIGGHLDPDGEFAWVTDEPFEYTAWRSGEPNNGEGIEDAVMMWSSDGKWNDLPNDCQAAFEEDKLDYGPENFGFICEWDGISGKIVRSAFEQISGMDFDDKKGELREDSYGVLGWTRDGAYAVYKNISFGEGADTFTFNGISSNTDNYIELHIDSADGELIGTCQVDKTGAWGSYVDYSCAVTPVTGVHDLYLVFRHNKGPNIECCEVNWFVFSNGGGTVFNGHRYQRFDKGMTWDEAKAYCESLGGHLATVTSEDEQNVIVKLLSAESVRNSYWLGGQLDDKKLSWITGEPVDYTNFSPGQPDNYFGDEFGLQIFAKSTSGMSNFKWHDLSNSGESDNEYRDFFGLDHIGFICEWDDITIDTRTEWNGHKYLRIDDGMTWDEAEKYCEKLGGHLVTITSKDEQAFVETLIKDASKNSYWIGAYETDEGVYVWVTDEPMEYKHAMIDNYLKLEDRLMIYNKRSFGWWNDLRADGECNGEAFFGTENIGLICEWDDAASSGVKSAYSRIQGEDFNDGKGIEIAGTNNPDAASSDGGVIGWTVKGSYAVYNGVDFSGGTAKQIIMCASTTSSAPVNVFVYLDGDKDTGKLIATVPIEPTGIWNKYVINTQAVKDITGLHDVYLLFDGGLNLDYFYFAKSADTQAATLYGDANLDGKVTVADAVAIMQHIGNRDKYGLKPQGLINADVDGIAGVTGKDALVIQQVDAGMYKASELPLKAK